MTDETKVADYPRITLYMPADKLKRLKIYAIEHDCTPSDVIIKLVTEFLDGGSHD